MFKKALIRSREAEKNTLKDYILSIFPQGNSCILFQPTVAERGFFYRVEAKNYDWRN